MGTHSLDSLAAKLQELDLSADELAELDHLIARAEMYDAVAVSVTSDALIPAEVQNAIVIRTAQAAHTTRSTATAAFGDALSLLQANGRGLEVRLSPSRIVDEAWHQFILFTREYAEYCNSVAGRFIHHEPHIDGVERTVSPLSPSDTYELLSSLGYALTPALWAPDATSPALERLAAVPSQRCLA